MRFFKRNKHKTYALKVVEITQLTANAVAIHLHIPNKLKKEFEFTPGQYVNVEAVINGSKVKRSYSICSTTDDDTLQIGIKRIPNGLFSEFANGKLQSGDTFEVSKPEGRFVRIASRHLMGFAAGSGITPIISILKTQLQSHLTHTFTLVYGNKSPEETLFRDTLKTLKERYPNQFNVIYTFSQASIKDNLFGRIDAEKVAIALNKNSKPDHVYICGPEEMVKTTSQALENQNIDKTNIHYELFFSKQKSTDKIPNTQKTECELTVIHNHNTNKIEVPSGKTLLEAALKLGIEVPFSCMGGVCGTCVSKLKHGKAYMVANHVLSDDEVAEGLILTCQSYPKSDEITIDYDNA